MLVDRGQRARSTGGGAGATGSGAARCRPARYRRPLTAAATPAPPDQIRQVVATGTRDAEVHELAARLERAAGDRASARRHAQLAMALDPGDSGWRELGMDPVARDRR
jgi:hypothetical protein